MTLKNIFGHFNGDLNLNKRNYLCSRMRGIIFTHLVRLVWPEALVCVCVCVCMWECVCVCVLLNVHGKRVWSCLDGRLT